MENQAYHSFSIEKLYLSLQTRAQGLSTQEAFTRKVNVKKNKNKILIGFQLWLKQFQNPLMLLLVFAMILAFILGDLVDAWTIFVILFLGTSFSFWQENKATAAVALLGALIENKVQVIREDRLYSIFPRDLVIGDLLLVEVGDVLAADAVLVEAQNLYLQQAALTGEYSPQLKNPALIPKEALLQERTNVLFAGTSVMSGNGKAVVFALGKDTVLGKIGEDLQKKIPSAFEKGLRDFAYLILKISFLLAFFILIFFVYQGKSLFDAGLFALSFCIGMAPELLPAITSLTFALAAQKMAEKKVIVKKMSAMGTLGSVDVLCTDKTGTLTLGEISFEKAVDINSQINENISILGFLNAFFESGFRNPIDQSLLPIFPAEKAANYSKKYEIPYDFTRKRLTVVLEDQQHFQIITKGALENVLSLCDRVLLNDHFFPMANYSAQIERLFAELSQNGFRVLGLASAYLPLSCTDFSEQNIEKNMVFQGFLVFSDLPKKGVQEVVAALAHQQITTKMITGDNHWAASYIAQKTGIVGGLLRGIDLQKMTDIELAEKVLETGIFAEVDPDQKKRIVAALRKQGKVVAYLGDGINDVPPMHQADVSISVNNAVDVAKAAADLVLLEADLQAILEGILEGRKAFSNILKYIFINTSVTLGSMLTLLFSSLFLPFFPLLPAHIFVINFLTDFPFLTIASDRVDLIQLQKSTFWSQKLILRFMLFFGLHAFLVSGLFLFVFHTFFAYEIPQLQTGFFLFTLSSQVLAVFVLRNQKAQIGFPSFTLFLSSQLVLILGFVLPFFSFSAYFSWVLMPKKDYLLLFFFVFFYLGTLFLLKKKFRFVEKNKCLQS